MTFNDVKELIESAWKHGYETGTSNMWQLKSMSAEVAWEKSDVSNSLNTFTLEEGDETTK